MKKRIILKTLGAKSLFPLMLTLGCGDRSVQQPPSRLASVTITPLSNAGDYEWIEYKITRMAVESSVDADGEIQTTNGQGYGGTISGGTDLKVNIEPGVYRFTLDYRNAENQKIYSSSFCSDDFKDSQIHLIKVGYNEPKIYICREDASTIPVNVDVTINPVLVDQSARCFNLDEASDLQEELKTLLEAPSTLYTSEEAISHHQLLKSTFSTENINSIISSFEEASNDKLKFDAAIICRQILSSSSNSITYLRQAGGCPVSNDGLSQDVCDKYSSQIDQLKMQIGHVDP